MGVISSGEGHLPDLDVFVDSPLAAQVTALTARHFELFDEEARRLAHRPMQGINRVRLRFTENVKEDVATVLADKIKERTGWHARIPSHGETARL